MCLLQGNPGFLLSISGAVERLTEIFFFFFWHTTKALQMYIRYIVLKADRETICIKDDVWMKKPHLDGMTALQKVKLCICLVIRIIGSLHQKILWTNSASANGLVFVSNDVDHKTLIFAFLGGIRHFHFWSKYRRICKMQIASLFGGATAALGFHILHTIYVWIDIGKKPQFSESLYLAPRDSLLSNTHL